MKVHNHYESVEEFLDKAKKLPSDKQGSSKNGMDSWAGCSLSEALELQERGWSDRPDISKMAKELNTECVSEITEMHTEMSVQGSYVDVATFLEGTPECMVEFRDQPAPKVIRIGFNLSTASNMSSKAFENRGAIVLALYRKLCAAGYSVEIVCYRNVRKGICSYHCASFVLKGSDQNMDEDELAFWCCHPAALRRLGFLHCESLPVDVVEKFGYKSGGGYSTPSDLAAFKEAEYALDLDTIVEFRQNSFELALDYYEKKVQELNKQLS